MAAKRQPKKAEVLEINDLETMKLLTHPARLAIIEALSEPRSVKEIAEVLEVPRTRLYHHIKLLEERGILRVASTRKKGALEEKLFDTTAHSFSPGAELLESDDRPERVEAIVAAVLDSTREDLRRSLLKQFAEDQEDDEPEQTSLTRSIARLKPAEAESFINDLNTLIGKYGQMHPDSEASEETKLYALTLVFYPSSRQGS